MGFTINENIITSYGSEVKNAYCSIMGEYHIARKEITEVNMDPQFLIDNGFNVLVVGYKYIVYTVANIWFSKQTYQGKKSPILSNINLEEEITLQELESSENIYEFIYNKLKMMKKIKLPNFLKK